jgi:predicted nuclease of restriction endonuclease-like (RecB) superfamily
MTRETAEEREFYLRLALGERFSVRELLRQIESTYFERSLNSAKLSPVMRELHAAATHTFKDNYVFEFLGLPDPHDESDLQKALIRHMRAFVLELSSTYIFVDSGDESPCSILIATPIFSGDTGHKMVHRSVRILARSSGHKCA